MVVASVWALFRRCRYRLQAHNNKTENQPWACVWRLVLTSCVSRGEDFALNGVFVWVKVPPLQKKRFEKVNVWDSFKQST